MHSSASELGRRFIETYWKPEFKRILDIGSLNVTGSLRDHCPQGAEYVGIDLESGHGVDLVLEDPYHYPFSDGYFDLIVSTSCFEHDPMFWVTFLEASRVLSPHGFLYINAASNGGYHPHPRDSWRFYPDAALALEYWAQKSGAKLQMVESFTAGRAPGEFWNDYVMIFGGVQSDANQFMSYVITNIYNVRQRGHADLINPSDHTEDTRIIREKEHRINLLSPPAYEPTLPSQSRRLTIFCVAHKRYENIYVLVHSMMCQTIQNFKLVIIHDGPDERMSAIFDQLRARYPNRPECYFRHDRYNDYGHTLRDITMHQEFIDYVFLKIDDDDLGSGPIKEIPIGYVI